MSTQFSLSNKTYVLFFSHILFIGEHILFPGSHRYCKIMSDLGRCSFAWPALAVKICPYCHLWLHGPEQWQHHASTKKHLKKMQKFHSYAKTLPEVAPEWVFDTEEKPMPEAEPGEMDEQLHEF